MAIRAKKEWGLWFLAPHHSQLVASLHPSYMAAELIVCLALWMIKLLWATGWEGQTRLASIYMQGAFPSLPRRLEICFFHYLLDDHRHLNRINQIVTVIQPYSGIQRANAQLIIHSFCLETESARAARFRSCVINVLCCRGRAAACLKEENGNRDREGVCERSGKTAELTRSRDSLKVKARAADDMKQKMRESQEKQSRSLSPCSFSHVTFRKLSCFERNVCLSSLFVLLNAPPVIKRIKQLRWVHFQEMSSGKGSPCVHSSDDATLPDNVCMETAKQTHPRQSCSTLNPPCNTCRSLSACITDLDRSEAMCSCACVIIPDHHSVQHLHVVTSNGLDVKLHYLALFFPFCQADHFSLPLVPPSSANGGQEKWSYGLLMNGDSSPPAYTVYNRAQTLTQVAACATIHCVMTAMF